MQPLNCCFCLRGDFIGMLDVGRDVERFVTIKIGEEIDQFIIGKAHWKNPEPVSRSGHN